MYAGTEPMCHSISWQFGDLPAEAPVNLGPPPRSNHVSVATRSMPTHKKPDASQGSWVKEWNFSVILGMAVATMSWSRANKKTDIMSEIITAQKRQVGSSSAAPALFVLLCLKPLPRSRSTADP